MTPFDHFQTATCLIAEGDRPALKWLRTVTRTAAQEAAR